MKLSISNIAWDKEHDEEIYQFLSNNGYAGIEIAPTRLVPNSPYDNIELSMEIVENIKNKYQLEISSMQSIWFGRNESIFGSLDERKILISYTEKAINYAKAIKCENMVFGCPRNRNIDDVSKFDDGVKFFKEIGDIAYGQGVVIALEPNPTIYHTNFMNRTDETIEFLKKVDSPGLKLNVDLGTVIWNNENLDDVFSCIDMIHHIHISEPNLIPIEHREMHVALNEILLKHNYERYVSIEMKNQMNIDDVKTIMNYVNEVMG